MTMYRFDTDSEGCTILTKTVQVTLDEVEIVDAGDGSLQVVERDVDVTTQETPAVHGDKYRLEPDQGSGLQRLVALRTFRGVHQGERGGLVDGPQNLAQAGDCWIHEDSVVTGGATVSGHAKVWDSRLSGKIYIGGMAFINSCNADITHGTLSISDMTRLVGCDITASLGASISLGGDVEVRRSALSVEPHQNLIISGGCFTGGDVGRQSEVVSVQAAPYGWITAFRGPLGDLRIAVGCQVRGDWDGIRRLASEVDLPQVQRDMLDGFEAMVEAARKDWRPRPEPGQEKVVGDDDDDDY